MALYLGDVRSNVATATNTVVEGPARIRSIYYSANASAGSIVFRDGGGSGATVISIATPASGYGNIMLPGDGVLCSTNVHATLTNIASITVFYA